MSFTLQVLSTPPAPGSCYPPTWTLAVAQIAQSLQVTGFDSLSTFSYGPATPAVNLQDRPWVKTDAQYKLIGIYTFTNGSWQPAPPYAPPGTILDFFGNQSSI